MTLAASKPAIRRLDITHHARRGKELTGAVWSDAEAPVRIGTIDKVSEHDIHMPSAAAPPHLSLVLLLEGKGHFLMGEDGAPCEFRAGHCFLSCSWEAFDCQDFVPAHTRFKAVTLRYPLAWRHAVGPAVPAPHQGCDVYRHPRANAWLARMALPPALDAFARALCQQGLPQTPLAMLEVQAAALQALHAVVTRLHGATAAPPAAARADVGDMAVSGRDRRRLMAARQHIDGHLASRLQLAAVAAAANMNETALKQGFSRLFGVTVHAYIVQSRSRLASELLRDSALPVGEIALRCGFSGASHLARHFKSMFNTTPLQYRHGCK
ncbi:helix-turn-helix transcriptional regulator [Rugamonas rubra]|uniref:Helix-turn-helix domain-containing protein n=1 Tax=Rugamonas rubra TaxID=758825 RepID=A0A1I4LEP5_9BURK|nr:AraC family transcriptional regulator [Rugamonas rubra]SFL89548.1 Helix-turn-helix domain-containing protein [Rugamonas rubra]